MGALSGFVFSGGNAINVSFGSTIAQSGIVNNYLTHADVAELEQDLARCERENGGSCEDQALADIIEKFRTRSSDRDAILVATCARDMACVNDLLQDVATNSLGEWNDIQTDYWEVYTGLSDVIRPGELVSIHQGFLLEQVPLQNAFALDNCGGVWSPACENAYQLAAVENLLMVGTVTGIGGLTVGAVRALVARAAASCGRDPRCWVGFLGREVGEEALSEVAAGGAMVTGTVTLADEIASAVRVAYPPANVGVPNLTVRGTLTNRFPDDPAVLQSPPRTLVQDSSGRYWLESSSGNRITPSGSYDFVTLPDGTVRVARPNTNQDFSTHLGLSGGGEVNYAGSIRFGNNDGPNRGAIVNWSNNSGHYTPPVELSGNAGLPASLFTPHP